MNTDKLTSEDIAAWVAKESPPEKATIIRKQLEDPESFASVWVAEIYRRIANPEKVDWLAILLTDTEEDSAAPDSLAASSKPARDAAQAMPKETGVIRGTLRWFSYMFTSIFRMLSLKSKFKKLETGDVTEGYARSCLRSHFDWALGCMRFNNKHINYLFQECNSFEISAKELLKDGNTIAASVFVDEYVSCLAAYTKNSNESGQSYLSMALLLLGDCHQATGNIEDAKLTWMESLELLRAGYGDGSEGVAKRATEVASRVKSIGDEDGAKHLFQLAKTISHNIGGTHHPLNQLAANELERINTVGTQHSVFPKSQDATHVELKEHFSTWRFLFIYFPATIPLTVWRNYLLKRQDYQNALQVAEILRVVSAKTFYYSEHARELGVLYWITGDNERAKDELLAAERAARRSNNKDHLLSALTSLANYYTDFGENELAAKCQSEQQAIENRGEIKQRDERSWISRQAAAAIQQSRAGDPEQAESILQAAIEWIESNKDTLSQHNTYLLKGVMLGNLAAIHRQRDADKAAATKAESRRCLEMVLEANHTALTEANCVVSLPVRVENRLDSMPLIVMAA